MQSDPVDAFREMIIAIVREELARAAAKHAPAPDGYISVGDAAALASVAPGTIRRWVRSGALPRCGAGRLLRVPRAALEELLRGGPTLSSDNGGDLSIERRAVARVRRLSARGR